MPTIGASAPETTLAPREVFPYGATESAGGEYAVALATCGCARGAGVLEIVMAVGTSTAAIHPRWIFPGENFGIPVTAPTSARLTTDRNVVRPPTPCAAGVPVRVVRGQAPIASR
jgi:hypothetical protein